VDYFLSGRETANAVALAKCKELKAQGGVRPAPARFGQRTFRAPTSGIAPLARDKDGTSLES